jgi:thioredoxin-related protein
MLTHTRRSILAVFLGSLLGAGFGSGFNPALADHNDAPSAPQNADTQLIMVEQTGCAYCARWNAEISDIYPKTPEGKFAPLRRIDLHAPRPTDVTFNGPLVVTPTFVLVEDGHETARIEGYGGDEMFWAMLTVTLQNHSTFDLQATE